MSGFQLHVPLIAFPLACVAGIQSGGRGEVESEHEA